LHICSVMAYVMRSTSYHYILFPAKRRSCALLAISDADLIGGGIVRRPAGKGTPAPDVPSADLPATGAKA
jgi:hypothetical protein